MGNKIRIADIKATKNPDWMQVVFTTAVKEGSLLGVIARADFSVATAYEPVATAIAETMVVGTEFEGYRIEKLSQDTPFYEGQKPFVKTGLYHRSRVVAAE
jgi:hypothetical protein